MTQRSTQEPDGGKGRERPINLVFDLACQLCLKLGEHPIKDKLWSHQIDDHWKVTINGKKETFEGIPPFEMLIEFNGWPAGIVSPLGDGVIAAGSIANEDVLIEALEKAIKRVQA